MNPLATLAPLSALLGALLVWIFRSTADVDALRKSVNRVQARLLEFWLYVDEPSLVWNSWKGLISANARLYRLLAVPLLVLTILMTPVYFWLDSLYGSSPLPIGKPALVTLGVNHTFDGNSPVLSVTAPDGIAVESPGVRVFSQHQVSWRVRPLRPLAGEFEWTIGGKKISKGVVAGDGVRFHSLKRTQSFAELIRFPTELPLPAGAVNWISISYPAVSIELLGFEAHWSAWFLAFSLAGAILFSKLIPRYRSHA